MKMKISPCPSLANTIADEPKSAIFNKALSDGFDKEKPIADIVEVAVTAKHILGYHQPWDALLYVEGDVGAGAISSLSVESNESSTLVENIKVVFNKDGPPLRPTTALGHCSEEGFAFTYQAQDGRMLSAQYAKKNRKLTSIETTLETVKGLVPTAAAMSETALAIGYRSEDPTKPAEIRSVSFTEDGSRVTGAQYKHSLPEGGVGATVAAMHFAGQAPPSLYCWVANKIFFFTDTK